MRLAFPTLHFLYSQLSAIVYRNGSQKREAFYQNLFQEAPSISEDQRKDPRLLAPMLQRVCDFNKKKKKKKKKSGALSKILQGDNRRYRHRTCH